MANVTLWGASYTDVPAVTLPKTGGGLVTFYENGGGGGGDIPGKLIKTQSLGTISTTSSTTTDTGITITVSDVDDYELLLMQISSDTPYTGTADSKHIASFSLFNLSSGTGEISSKTALNTVSGSYNILNMTGIIAGRYNGTKYGIYSDGNNNQFEDGELTISLKMRYSSTYTKTINSAYTAYIYGIRYYDMIFG